MFGAKPSACDGKKHSDGQGKVEHFSLNVRLASWPGGGVSSIQYIYSQPAGHFLSQKLKHIIDLGLDASKDTCDIVTVATSEHRHVVFMFLLMHVHARMYMHVRVYVRRPWQMQMQVHVFVCACVCKCMRLWMCM